MSFNFGSTTKPIATGFPLPTNPAAAPPPSTFQFNTGSGDNKLQNKPITTLFGTPTTIPSSFSLGTTPQKTTAPTLSFGSAVAAVAPTLSLGTSSGIQTSTPATAPPQFGFGSSLTASTTTFTPILGSATTVSSAGSLSLGLPSATSATGSTATATPKLTFGSLTTTAASLAPTSLGTTTASSTALAPTSVTAAPSSGLPTASLTFGQLEDSINKWTVDLEEQAKFFINQAKQLNAWDALLISNGEKILNLNGSIGRVKQLHQQLDQELDFVLAQQKELEELITPLEKDLVDIPVTDIDRNQMYQLTESIDSQLKQMSDDLKEIIEQINDSKQDEEESNPVTQISRILNAHMNSLQWIDRNTAQISSQLEEINKLQDSNRRNFSLNHSLNNM